MPYNRVLRFVKLTFKMADGSKIADDSKNESSVRVQLQMIDNVTSWKPDIPKMQHPVSRPIRICDPSLDDPSNISTKQQRT